MNQTTRMTRQAATPLVRIQYDTTTPAAAELASLIDKGGLDIHNPQQAILRWSYGNQIGLIRSWLTGTPIDPITVNNRGTSAWQRNHPDHTNQQPAYAVLDGQQRLYTARAWFSSNLPVPASWFTPTELGRPVSDFDKDGPYVTFADLTPSVQAQIQLHWKFTMHEVRLPNLAAEAEVYQLRNGRELPRTPIDDAQMTDLANRYQFVDPDDFEVETADAT